MARSSRVLHRRIALERLVSLFGIGLMGRASAAPLLGSTLDSTNAQLLWPSVTRAYASIKSYKHTCRAVIERDILGQTVTLAAESRLWFVAPRVFRYESTIGNNLTIYVFDGRKGWKRSPNESWVDYESERQLTAAVFGGSVPLFGAGYWPLSMLLYDEDLAYPSLREFQVTGVVSKDDYVDGESCLEVEGLYRNRQSLRIWVSNRDHLIRRAVNAHAGYGRGVLHYYTRPNVHFDLTEVISGIPK